MRIALVVPEYPPSHIGGGGVVFQALAEMYSGKHDVTVFAGHDPMRSNRVGLHEILQVSPTLRVLRYPLVPIFKTQAYMRSVPPPGLAALARLHRDLVEWDPDVAHVHGVGYGTIDTVSWFLRRRRIPYVLTNHGLPVTPLGRNVWVRDMYGLYISLVAKRTLDGASIVSAVSQSASQETEKQFGRKVVVVPNGLSRLPNVSRDESKQWRRRFHVEDDEVVIAAAGRLGYSKGFDVLVSALNHLPCKRVICVIAGDDAGELNSLVKQSETLGAGRRVVFTGRLDRRELSGLLSVAAVAVVPSRSEPFGLIALEAMSCMCRVVVSDVDGLRDVASDGVSVLVRPNNPSELADAISQAIVAGHLSAEERYRVSQRLEDFDWQSIAERYLDLLGQIAK